jgi:hypothetical protein
MEILLEQRFSNAKISLLKNYCKLVDFQDYKYKDIDWEDKKVQSLDFFAIYSDRKNTKFFKEKSSLERGYAVEYPKFELVKNHFTTSDKQITRHYNNPFAHLVIEIIERSIKKKGDKILISSLYYKKERGYNRKYFTTHITKNHFSFDFKTGNFQVIETFGKGKKKSSKIFRTNNFIFLKQAIKNNYGFFNIAKYYSRGSKFKKEIHDNLNDGEFIYTIGKLFGIDGFLSNDTDNYHDKFYNKIVESFIEYRKIKVPNHSFVHLLEYSYPKEVLFKKNDRKLVASVLDMYGIKTKFTIKLLHNYPFLNLITISKLCLIFGKDYQKYLSSIRENIFAASQTRNREVNALYSISDYKIKILEYNISDTDKENIVRILNDEKYQKPITEDTINDLLDHFRMINKIKYYDNKLTMKAKTYLEFTQEHQMLSKIMSTIKKGWIIEYVYNEKTIHQIEEPLSKFVSDEIGEVTFYPTILRREDEYSEEGKFMHHCVGTYADKDKSMIISIRKNNNTDRVTCEFDIQSGNMIQARYFCNAQPPEEYQSIIEHIQDLIMLLARYGILNWKEKIKSPVKINGIEVIPNGPTRPDDYLWEII